MTEQQKPYRRKSISLNHKSSWYRRVIGLHCDWFPVRTQGKPDCRQMLFKAGAAAYMTIDENSEGGYDAIYTEDRERLLDWIVAKIRGKSRLWLFAQDLPMQLQLCGFWGVLERADFKVERFILSDPPSVITASCGVGRVTMLDTANFAKASEQTLQEWCCPDVARLPWHRLLPSASFEGCGNSVCVTTAFARGISAFCKAVDCGNAATTTAGIAWNAFRHRFLKRSIPLHDNASALALEREAYYGGDVIPFHLGKAEVPLYQCDVNGLYPHVMGQNAFPTKLWRYKDNASYADLKDACNSAKAVAAVEIDSLSPGFPRRENGKRVHVCGRYWTRLATPELVTGIDLGIIRSVGQLAVYDGEYLFGEWSEYWHKLRRRSHECGDGGMVTLCKLVSNALSGKFAQRSSEWEYDDSVKPEMPFGEWWHTDAETGRHELCQTLGWKTRVSRSKGEWHSSHPAIASHITSEGRVFMSRLREVAGEYAVYYQDTDSLFVPKPALERLTAVGCLSDTRQGGLRVVDGPLAFVCHAAKVYQFGDKHVSAGLKRECRLDTNGEWTHTLFEGVRGILSHASDGAVSAEERKWRLASAVLQRRVTPDGWTWPLYRGVE